MAEGGRLILQLQSADGVAVLPNLQNDFNDIVDVTLRVNASRDCQAHQVHLCGRPEHQRTDLYGTNAALEIKFGRKRNTGKLVELHMRKESACINVDCMSARGLHNGDA